MSGLERDGELLFCGKRLGGDIWSDGEELAMHRSGRNFPGRWGNKNLRSEISRMPEEYVGGRCSWSRWRQGRVAGQTLRGLLDPNLSVVAPLRSLPSRQAMPNSLLTLRTAARQASLSFTTSRSLLKLRSLHRWCHPTISSSVVPFSSCPQSFPASGSLPVSAWRAQAGECCHLTGLLVEQGYLFIFQRWWTLVCSSIQSTYLAPHWWWLGRLEWYQAPLCMGFSRPEHWSG